MAACAVSNLARAVAALREQRPDRETQTRVTSRDSQFRLQSGNHRADSLLIALVVRPLTASFNGDQADAGKVRQILGGRRESQALARLYRRYADAIRYRIALVLRRKAVPRRLEFAKNLHALLIGQDVKDLDKGNLFFVHQSAAVHGFTRGFSQVERESDSSSFPKCQRHSKPARLGCIPSRNSETYGRALGALSLVVRNDLKTRRLHRDQAIGDDERVGSKLNF
jgi:hypothetical protein